MSYEAASRSLPRMSEPIQPTRKRSWPARHKVLTALGVLLVLFIALIVASVATNPTPAPTASVPTTEATAAAPAGPADQLRDSDMSDGAVVAASDAYQRAFATLQTRCNNPPDKLVLYVGNTLHVLQSKGVNDETRFTLLQHLAASVPATGVGPVDCADIATAYVTLRAPQAG